MQRKRIGVIDSGVGGLSLVKKMQDENLDVECFYICDHANVPYGQKSQDFMLSQSQLMVSKLMEQNIRNILIACNTLTVETINLLREEFPEMNFVGIEPFVNYLNHPSSTGEESIGLILTQATFNSERFKYLQKTFDKKQEVDVYPLANLAILIEQYFNHEKSIWSDIVKELEFIHSKNWTHIILGCTHYPLIREYFEQELGLVVIDPHFQVIKQLEKVAKIKRGDPLTLISYSNDVGETWQKQKI